MANAYDNPLDVLATGPRVKRLYEDWRDSHADEHAAMRDEIRFCWDLEQYQQDTGNTRDRERVQPRDQTPFRLLRYKASAILKVPPYFRARPIDDQRQLSAQGAHWARWGVEHELDNPQNRLDRVLADVVWAGLTTSIGCATSEWEPGAGIFGDIRYRFVEGDSVGWAPGFNDPHDPECPWFLEVSRPLVSEIRAKRGWKNTAQVVPDDGYRPMSDGSGGATGVGGETQFSSAAHPQAQPMKTQPRCTVVKLWERNNGGKVKRSSYRVLTDEERYMEVALGARQGERVHMDYGDQPMPEFDVMHDGTPLRRVDKQLTEEERLAYPNGKLTIVAIFSPGDDGEGVVLYEGNWPQPMRTFPYLVWQPYASPFRQLGTNDVRLGWTLSLVKNGTMRRWYEQLHESRGIVLLPSQGLTDAYGEPFMYTDANGVQAFYSKQMPPSGVNFIHGPEPSPQLERFYRMVDSAQTQKEGTGEVSTGGSAQELKGVAVGTIERAMQSGNLPVDDHIRSWQVELGLFFSVIHDIQRARWTEQRMIRYLGNDGHDAYVALRGDDIPACDIIISARPTLDQFNAEKLQALQQFAQIAQMNPAIAHVAAKYMNLDPEDIKEIMQAVSAPPANPPAPGGPPRGPSGPPAPMNGAGAPPFVPQAMAPAA